MQSTPPPSSEGRREPTHQHHFAKHTQSQAEPASARISSCPPTGRRFNDSPLFMESKGLMRRKESARVLVRRELEWRPPPGLPTSHSRIRPGKRGYTSAKSLTSRLLIDSPSMQLVRSIARMASASGDPRPERHSGATVCWAWASPRSSLFQLSPEEPFTQCSNWHENCLESVTVRANQLRIGSVCLRCGRR
jgi:hypothetical protein